MSVWDDDGLDRLAVQVLRGAVVDACGLRDSDTREEAREWLRLLAPDLAERLEAAGWRIDLRRLDRLKR